MGEWIALALRRDIVLRGLRISALVGTILVAINQGNYIVAGIIPVDAIWKIPLTYLVPYLVSTYASVAALCSDAPPTMED